MNLEFKIPTHIVLIIFRFTSISPDGDSCVSKNRKIFLFLIFQGKCVLALT